MPRDATTRRLAELRGLEAAAAKLLEMSEEEIADCFFDPHVTKPIAEAAAGLLKAVPELLEIAGARAQAKVDAVNEVESILATGAPASTSWHVDKREGFDTGGNWMKAGCHHVRHYGRGDPSACGGCYARAVEALNQIAKGGDPKAITDALFAAMKAEAPRG